ncbi:O-antigen ligase family protein [Sporolactobacillus terrae]|uniref:O-antigen ligase-related domain-containing protein n=1 Tax=Sporolactobacillus terrae TaxID=269673 RepID=A0ABX5Q4I4_9BACL|nr:O-antigen ligase family protein [Sporolactobacillus terrae]QAA21558.1 hypothetical protein C0674_02355 [Sporolactobacillus terrae]QAA24530.1 hypothetical protein C0679_02335 [Sporolactobacillus terrae]
MAYLLIPISLFYKQIIPNIYIYYVPELPLYVYCFLIGLAYYNDLRNKRRIEIWSAFNKRVILCFLSIMIFQLIAMKISSMTIGDSVFNKSPLSEFIKLLVVVGCVFIHYLVVKKTIATKQSLGNFIRGNGIALVILLCICYLQFLFLLFPNVFSSIVRVIGIFEYRYNRDWYTAGSYVQTLRRINGLNPEPGYLAAQLLVVFVPFIMASIKNKVNVFSFHSKYYHLPFFLLLFSIVILLFFAKTTTGIAAILVILISLWFLLPNKQKLITILLLPIAGAVVFIVAKSNPVFMGVISTTFIDKLGGDSFINRAGSTIGLITTWLHHPVFGVGNNFHNYYLFKYVPEWAMSNFEYNTVFKPQNYYPILSVFFGWLAEFGTLFIIFIVTYSVKLLNDLRRLAQSVETNQDERSKVNAIKDAAFFFFIYYFVCSLVSFNWYESIYLIMIFYFVVARQILRREYQNELKYS